MLNLEYPPLGGGAAPVTQGPARALVGRGHSAFSLSCLCGRPDCWWRRSGEWSTKPDTVSRDSAHRPSGVPAVPRVSTVPCRATRRRTQVSGPRGVLDGPVEHFRSRTLAGYLLPGSEERSRDARRSRNAELLPVRLTRPLRRFPVRPEPATPRLAASDFPTTASGRIPARDFASTRFSGLEQITVDNVARLRPAFTFSTGVLRGHEAVPIVVGDTMYCRDALPNILLRARPDAGRCA